MRQRVLLLLTVVTLTSSQDLFTSINLRIGRARRETLDESAFWSITCVTSLIKRINESDFDRQRLAQFQYSPTTVCLNYSAGIFRNLCESFRIAEKCMAKGPDGKMRMVLNESMDLLRMMCSEKYEDFQDHLPCIMDSCPTIVESCGMRCQPKRKSVEKLFDAVFLSSAPLYSKGRFVKLLKDSCRQNLRSMRYDSTEMALKIPDHLKQKNLNYSYLSCHLECRRPHIDDQCSSNASALENELTRRLIGSASHILRIFFPTKYDLPEECLRWLPSYACANSARSSFVLFVLIILWVA